MGMCKPSGGKKSLLGPYRHNIDKTKESSNIRVDYYDETIGQLLQQRWYGPDGRAIWDRDWDHGNQHNHTFPHDHIWEWKTCKDHPPRPQYNGSHGEKINEEYC